MNDYKRIADFAKVKRGASPRPITDPKWFGEGVGWVRIVDVTRSSRFLRETEQHLSSLGETKSVRVDQGDLIMSICATIGKPIIVDMPACIHDGFVHIYDIQDADVAYLYYVLQFTEDQLVAKGQPGTQVNLNTSIVGNHRVFAPSLPEQRKIARILSTVDDLIERTEALIAKYRAIKQGLMHDLLTRGVDASGRLRLPREEAPGLYRESAVGWVPREWEVVTLGAIVRERGGFIQTGPFGSQLHAHEYVASGVPMVMPQDIEDGFIREDKIAYITDKKAGELSRHIMTSNDVVFARRGDLSRCAAIGQREAGWLCGTGSMLLRASPEVIYGRWLSYFYSHDWGQRQILARVVGSTMVNLNSMLLQRLVIARPDVREQKQIVERLDAQDRQIGVQAESRSKLALIKAGLMQDLLTGRVRVGAGRLDHGGAK